MTQVYDFDSDDSGVDVQVFVPGPQGPPGIACPPALQLTGSGVVGNNAAFVLLKMTGAAVVTLPDANQFQFGFLVLKLLSGSATLQPVNGQTIDAQASFNLQTINGVMGLFAFGGNWFIW